MQPSVNETAPVSNLVMAAVPAIALKFRFSLGRWGRKERHRSLKNGWISFPDTLIEKSFKYVIMLTINRCKNRLEKLIMKTVKFETRPQVVRFWGQDFRISPAYCGVVHGNGRQVMWLKTGDSRPNYYVLRIDSQLDLSVEDFDAEILLSAIEERFGNVDDYVEHPEDVGKVRYRYADDDEPWEDESVREFPALSIGNGYWFGSVKTF